MAKKHLLPDENEEFLDRLGLTDVDKKVYIAALDGGLVSAGEIQQFTEITDLGKILESIRDMVDLGLIKKARGSMPRYYATLPFFRETLSVEREFKFALEAMLHSLSMAHQETVKNRELIVATRFPKIVDELLDRYYKDILSPIVADLEGAKKSIKDSLLPFIKEVEAHNTNIKDEIALMLKPLIEYTDLLTPQFNSGISNESTAISESLTKRETERLEILKTSHTVIGNILEGLKKELTSLSQIIRNLHLKLEENRTTLQASNQTMNSQISSFSQSLNSVSDAKKEIQAELVVAREKIKRIAASPGHNTESEIDNIFQNLVEKIKVVDVSGEDVIASMSKTQEIIEHNSTDNLELERHLDATITTVNTTLMNYFDTLKNSMASVFTELNNRDSTSLGELKSSLEQLMNGLRDTILQEGNKVKDQLNSHITILTSEQEATLSRWQETMIGLFDRPARVIDSFLERWLDEIGPLIDTFKNNSDQALTEILGPIVELENGTFATLTERVGFVKAMIEGRSSDLQQVLVMAKKFDFTKTSDTWVVVGLPSIYASLTDLLLRTRTRVTIITPNLDLELAEVARTLKSTIRITIVTAIDPEKDARLVHKLEETGRIYLRHYPDRDLYACIRDSEELVFGYVREGEETMGIRASTPSIVQLIEDRFNETVIRNSKQI